MTEIDDFQRKTSNKNRRFIVNKSTSNLVMQIIRELHCKWKKIILFYVDVQLMNDLS